MRYIIPGLMFTAFVLGGISLLANVFYGLAISAGPERWLYAAAGGLTDVLKIGLPVAIALLIQHRRVWEGSKEVVLAFMFWGLATVWSITCAVGLYEIIREAKTGSTLAVKEQHRLLTAKKAELQMDLERYRAIIPVEIAQATLRAYEQDRLFGPNRTKACTDATLADSREFCQKVEQIRGQIAVGTTAADKAARISATEQAASATNTKLAGLSLLTVFSATDPATAAFARLTGIPPETVRAILALTLGLLLELGGSLVPFILAPGLARPKPVAESPDMDETPEIVPIELLEVDSSVEAWAKVGLARRRGSVVPAKELHDCYKSWAAVMGETPVNATAFGKELSAMGIDRKKSGKIVYCDVTVQPTKRPELTVVGK